MIVSGDMLKSVVLCTVSSVLVSVVLSEVLSIVVCAMVIVVSSLMLRLMCLSCNSLRVLENLYFSLGKDELGALCTFL